MKIDVPPQVCPCSVANSLPVETSQSFIGSSKVVEASNVPSGLNAREVTASASVLKKVSSSKVSALESEVPKRVTAAISLASGENWIAKISPYPRRFIGSAGKGRAAKNSPLGWTGEQPPTTTVNALAMQKINANPTQFFAFVWGNSPSSRRHQSPQNRFPQAL